MVETRWTRIVLIFTIVLTAGLLFILFRFVWMDQSIRGLIGQGDLLVGETSESLHAVLIASDSKSPFWVSLTKGAVEASKLYRIDLEVVEPEMPSSIRIAELIEKYTLAGVDMIMVEGRRQQAFTEASRRAMAANVVVVNVLSDSAAADREAFIGPNHYGTGQILADRISKTLNPGDWVALIRSNPESVKQLSRMNGMMSVLASNSIRTMTDVAVLPGQLHVRNKLLKMVGKESGIKAVICLGEDDVAGAVEALRILGRKDIPVFGFDSSEQSEALLKSGMLEAVIRTEAYQTGFDAVRIANDIRKGNNQSSVTEVKSILIDRQTLVRNPEVVQ